jgi:hypothetical protein
MKDTEKSIIETELRKIAERDGKVTPDAVVEAARPKTSPLHSHFQWNNDKAAHEYRLWQARQLIAVVVFERAPNDLQRTFTSVVLEKETSSGAVIVERAYVETKKALENPNLRQQILEEAIREAKHWSCKYRHFEELTSIVKAIDNFIEAYEANTSAAAA